MAQLFDTEPAAPEATAYAQVALEQGIDTAPEGLTYAVPPALAGLAPGERVRVPLGRGNKPASGFVVELRTTSELAKSKSLKAILARDPRGVSVPADLVALARWIAGYYCCPLGLVFATMLPAAVKKGSGSVTRRMVGLTAEPRPEAGGQTTDGGTPVTPRVERGEAPDRPPKFTKLQKAVLEAVQQRAAAGHAWTEIKELADLAGARSVSPVKQLLDKALLAARREEAVVSDLDLRAQQVVGALPTITLNAGQQQALEHLAEHLANGFGVHLLHGVTGSGKTEVYLRAIEAAMGRGQAAEGPREAEGSGEAVASVPSPSQGEAEKGLTGASRTAAENLNGTPGHQVEERDATAADPHSATRPPDHSTTPAPPGCIVLVPEIALTPQTVGRFIERFGPQRVAVLHSGLTASQRHAQWRRIRTGEAHIVVGARSAIFAPLANLRLIIVDEEHESSYKQDQAPRYHARDVAIKRAHMLGLPVVLGSATPSLEMYARVSRPIIHTPPKPADEHSESAGSSATLSTSPAQRSSPYHLIRLPDRAPGMKLPTVEVVDLSEERRKRYEMTGKAGIHLMSLRLENVLRQTLEDKGQAMLLLNRRGYANYIACPDHRCGWLMQCDYCDVTMVYHKDRRLPAGGVVRCHHCQAEQRLPPTCPACSKKLTVFGLGTQRVEEELAAKFPQARALRMDGDTMRHGRDYQQSLDAFRAGEVDVLLGTQMIAKGLDFPNVRLVGVISADTALNLPDFRAGERTFQLIAQVAGRAGRSDAAGRVIVQTFNPHDSAIQFAAAHDYDGFAQRELEQRAAVGLPPTTRMTRIVVRDLDHAACVQRAQTLATHLQQADAELGTNVRLRGPMPCPIARIADYHRQQIEMIAPTPAPMQKLLTAVRNLGLLRADQQTAVDVDPVALL